MVTDSNKAESVRIAKPKTVSLFGVDVTAENMASTVEWLAEAVRTRRTTQVITANPIMFMTGFENENFMRVLRSADLVVPDGAGLVWAARKLGKPVAERVAGFDLIKELFALGARQGWRFYLLGATQETIEAARDRILADYPGISVVGCRNGFFTADEDEQVAREIAEAKPDILLVGRSTMLQDPWIAAHRDKLQVPVMIGVGGSFDVLSGRLTRAPLWMQRMGLEWLYRLLLEPSRIVRMTALPKFMWEVAVYGEKRRIAGNNNDDL